MVPNSYRSQILPAASYHFCSVPGELQQRTHDFPLPPTYGDGLRRDHHYRRLLIHHALVHQPELASVDKLRRRSLQLLPRRHITHCLRSPDDHRLLLCDVVHHSRLVAHILRILCLRSRCSPGVLRVCRVGPSPCLLLGSPQACSSRRWQVLGW